jgi:hypothetical protein
MMSTPQSRRDLLKGALAIMTQTLPFADQRTRKLYGQLERGVYDALKAG